MLGFVARYPTKRAISAGGLVVDDRPDGRWVVLISRRNAAGALQWTLPKGGLEEGEDRPAAALREVREETGLECEIVSELGTIDYWFVWRPEEVRYHKFVHYYLMRHLGGDPAPRDDEAEDVEWLPLDEALGRLTHANERELVAAARVHTETTATDDVAAREPSTELDDSGRPRR
jgi:8-oxo-dGTP pyrophosphatase MutT (NUDIX family)